MVTEKIKKVDVIKKCKNFLGVVVNNKFRQPREFCYDEFAYNRMVKWYRTHIKKAIKVLKSEK